MTQLQQEQTQQPLRVFRINAGSCNGCDVELAATSLPRFDAQRLGFAFSEDPAGADIVLITGPLTVRVKDKVLELYRGIPEPKVTVAVGVCPISGGVFRDSYAVSAPVDRYLPVDVNVPGCPPRPQAIMEGLKAAAALRRRRDGKGDSDGKGDRHLRSQSPPAVSTSASEAAPETPEALRGTVTYNASACIGCRMCEHVCAGGAIAFTEAHDGLHFSLDHNACAFCGQCSHFCKTGALEQTANWNTAHYQEEKDAQRVQGTVHYRPCTGCGEPILPVAPELMRISFRAVNIDLERLKTLCPECRLKQAVAGAKR